MKKQTANVAEIPAILTMLQTYLWENDKYKLFFSRYNTGNADEYYCFLLDIVKGRRKHGRYKILTDNILIDFIGSVHNVKYLSGLRPQGIIMIQTANIDNELSYINWLGYDMPQVKGQPYSMELKSEI